MFLKLLISCAVLTAASGSILDDNYTIVFTRVYDSSISVNDSESEVWDEVRSLLEPCPNIDFEELDCAFNGDLCKELDVKHLPAYLAFLNNKLIDVYFGQRTVEALRSFCLSLLGMHIPRSLPVPVSTDETSPQPEHTCLRIGSSNFNNETSQGITLVIFYVWWCGHSKKFIPFFNQLDEKYQNNSTFKVRRVDCDAEQTSWLCLNQGVHGFPSLFLYNNGTQVAEYESKPNLEELIDIMESNATPKGIAEWKIKEEQRLIEYEAKQARKAERKRLEEAAKNSTTSLRL